MHLLKPQAGSESRRGKSSGHASDRTPDLVSHQKLHAPSSRTALGVRSSLEITKVMTLALGRAGRAGTFCSLYGSRSPFTASYSLSAAGLNTRSSHTSSHPAPLWLKVHLTQLLTTPSKYKGHANSRTFLF